MLKPWRHVQTTRCCIGIFYHSTVSTHKVHISFVRKYLAYVTNLDRTLQLIVWVTSVGERHHE